jgi:hypothetical protein
MRQVVPPKTRLFVAMVGMVDKMGINNLEKTLSWNSLEVKFLVWRFEVAQEHGIQRTPLAKSVAMLASM